ncbi:hypothetical protein FB45DRAFT_1020094 [Roridomyces roridus]|uniref:Uncharacterized protein n=1 Tax=Roridomyces roridus TaxID=1738132 RepID=A0AAD7G0K6_9AGAR|nr:hypothetical protein FB45DRAFT_1020094 [Roridomyces roridus]
MYPRTSTPRSDWSANSQDFYLVEPTLLNDMSMPDHIHHPQPVRAIPGLAWGTDQLRKHSVKRTHPDDLSGETTCFPDPENALGIFSDSPSTKYRSFARPLDGIHQRLQQTPPVRPKQIQDYQVEGGWSFDAAGRAHYVPSGGVEEIGDAEEVMPPVDVLVDASHTFFDQDQLPPGTTPPPGPIQRTIELLPLPVLDRLPLGDGSNTYLGGPPPPSVHDFSFHYDDDPTPCSSPTLLTQSQELHIIEQNLLSIVTSSLAVGSLHAKFAAVPAPSKEDLWLCDRVSEALHAVETSLRRRSQIPAEEWSLRSTSCQRKYDRRLLSLRKTLQRLHSLSTLARASQLDKIRALLKQHHAKLSDLAHKFNATFDRLHLRHVSTILSDLYNDIQRRVDGRKEDRKTARAAARVRLLREGRRPSLVDVS